ncbi:hypothetical protein [Desulfolithobacter sp.]
MNRESIIQREKGKILAQPESIDTEVNQMTMGALGMFTGLTGAWALACIIGGLVASTEVSGLLDGWFHAVSGL